MSTVSRYDAIESLGNKIPDYRPAEWMTEQLTDQQIREDRYARPAAWKRDRNDVYVVSAREKQLDTYTEVFAYRPTELNCCPDFDW